MFKYEIYIRLDDSEYMETDSVEVEASCMEDLFDRIKDIEKRHTIMYIKNLDVL